MKRIVLVVFGCLIVMSGFTANKASAKRTPKIMTYFFTPKIGDYDRRYEDGWDNAYNSDWEYHKWTPFDWAGDAQTAQIIVDNFYDRGVIMDQYVSRGTPVLEVGQTFVELSGRDQRRVVKFVAYAFGIDDPGAKGTMEVVLKRPEEDCQPLGVYSQGRVQLH